MTPRGSCRWSVGVKPCSPSLSLSITWQHSQTIEKMLHCHLQPLWDQFGEELASRNMAYPPATLVRLNKPPNTAAEMWDKVNISFCEEGGLQFLVYFSSSYRPNGTGTRHDQTPSALLV